MSNLSATDAKRRGFLLARIEADKTAIAVIDEKHAAHVKRLEEAAEKGKQIMAERQARLDKLRGAASAPSPQPAIEDDGA